MAMRAVLTGAALVGAGVTLCGCGGSGDDKEETTQPPPAVVGPVQKAWSNHGAAFFAGAAAGADAEGDAMKAALKDIIADYDADSTIAVFNDKCVGKTEGDGKRTGYEEHTGVVAIEAFYKAVFIQVKSAKNIASLGPTGGGAVIMEGDKVKANAFLTWTSANLESPDVINKATDTLTWQEKDGVAKVWKQTIVSTQPDQACSDTAVATDQCATDANKETPFCKGWTNHLKAFGDGAVFNGDDAKKTAALNLIMADYTDDSFIQLFDNKDKAYSTFDTKDKIRGLFDDLFKAIDAETNGTENGLKVPLLEVEPKFNQVFLVWQTFSHPKATDTFVFNADGKIIRQNIVVETAARAELSVQV